MMKQQIAEAEAEITASSTLAGQLVLVQRIREGFSYEEFEQSALELNLEPSDLCEFGIIAPRTLSHAKRAGRLSSVQSDRVAGFLALYKTATQTFGTTDRARRWFERPTKALDDRTPMQLLDTQIGVQLVDDLLKRIDYGLAT